MVEQNRRFIIVQDDNADKPFNLSKEDPARIDAESQKEANALETEDLTNDLVNQIYDKVKEGFYSEKADFSEVKLRPDSGQPNVGISSIVSRTGEDDPQVSTVNYSGSKRTLGDISASGAMIPDQTYTANPEKTILGLYPKFVPETMKTKLVSGEGIISSSGSGDRSRFVFKKEGESQFQFRTTPNYFGKTTDVLSYHKSEESSPGVSKSYSERVYNRPGLLPLKNGNLLSYYSNQGSPPWTWGWATGIKLSGDTGIAMPQGPGVRGDGAGSDSGGDGLIRMHLLDKKTMLWSDSPIYNGTYVDFPQGNVADAAYANSAETGITGISFVQFEDTEEVLCIYSGYFGSVSNGTTNTNRPNQYLKVDVVNNRLRSASEIYYGTTDESYTSVDNPTTIDAVIRSDTRFGAIYDTAQDREGNSDVVGMELANPEFIIDISAQALPSGRLVVIMATNRQLLSLISDDRGVTFRSNKILDLTFSEDPSQWKTSAYMQRFVSVDSCLTDSGSLAIIVACNGIGDRGINSDVGVISRQESVISVFISGTGEMWGREKTLGGGTSTDNFVSGSGDGSSEKTNNLCESIYPLDASICLTVDGYLQVSVIGAKAGAPTGTHAQWIFTRTFSERDISNNAWGQEVARSIPDTLQGSVSPWDTRTHRLVPARCNLATQNSIPQRTQESGDPGSTILLTSYLDELSGFPIVGTTGGYVFNGESSSLATSNVSNNPGGGPVRCNGAFGISTVRWRGQIVTILSNYFSDKVLDFPDSRTYLASALTSGWPSPYAHRTRSVSISMSNHFQPSSVRIPTQGAVFAPLLKPNSDGVVNGRFNISSYKDTDKYGNTFGSNSYSLSWDTSWNPEDTGWYNWKSGDPSAIEDAEFTATSQFSKKCIGGAWKISTGNANSLYAYSFPDNYAKKLESYGSPLAFDSVAFKNGFPNSDSMALKTSEDGGNTDQSMSPLIKGGMGFVCRAVVCPVENSEIHEFDPSNPDHINPQSGVRVALCDGQPTLGSGGTDRRQVVLSVDCLRQSTGKKCEFVLYTSRNNGATVERIADSRIVIEDFDSRQDNNAELQEGRAGWFEVLFGFRYEKGEESLGIVRPFLYVRQWNRIDDPDFTDDFKFNPSLDTYITPYPLPGQTGPVPLWDLTYEQSFPMREGIQFGNLRAETSATGKTVSLWKSVQFSRTYLKYESTDVKVWSGSVDSIDFGEDGFTESLHQNPEPPMGMFQINDAGCVSPMGPGLTSVTPAFLDRNIHSVFRGRAATNKVFNYSGKSRFPVSNIMSEPSYYGWRASSDKVSAWVTSRKIESEYSPTTVLTLDFGDVGIKPQGIAGFGINAPALMFQLSNNEAYNQDPFDPVNDGSKQIATSPLYDPYHKMDRFFQQDTASTPDTCWMWSPRYLFYCQMNNPADGYQTIKSQGELMFRIYGNRISFYPFISSMPSSFSPASTVPFRPHQFRSQGTEEYFICLYDALMPSAIPQSGSGSIRTAISAGEGGQYRHVFRIKDNTATELIVDQINDSGDTLADRFGEISFDEGDPSTPRFNGSGSEGYKTLVGSVAVYSNRMAFNLPQNTYQEPTRFDGSVSPGISPTKYRYLRIRVEGATYYSQINTHTIGSIIAGNVIDLSNRDFEWGYGLKVSPGNIMSTSKTGERRSRFMHSPRKAFSVSYNPRASEPHITDTMAFSDGGAAGTSMKAENPQRGFGNSGQNPEDFTNPDRNDYMLSFLSRLSWEEIVDRVRRLGVKGEVFALGFRGINMVYSKSYLRGITDAEYNLFQHPVLSDPMFMVPARIVSFGGGTHITYTAMSTLAADGNHPFPCLQIGPIEFSEEI